VEEDEVSRIESLVLELRRNSKASDGKRNHRKCFRFGRIFFVSSSRVSFISIYDGAKKCIA